MLKTKKAIRFRHPDYNPDRTQKLISSSMSQHLLTCNVSMHALLSNLDNRQTDKHLQKHLPPPLSEVKLIRSFLDINPATDLGFLNLKSDWTFIGPPCGSCCVFVALMQNLYVSRDSDSTSSTLDYGDMQSISDLGLCVVCQVSPVERALLPCRHACICNGCFAVLLNCPLCRTFITSSFDVTSSSVQGRPNDQADWSTFSAPNSPPINILQRFRTFSVRSLLQSSTSSRVFHSQRDWLVKTDVTPTNWWMKNDPG